VKWAAAVGHSNGSLSGSDGSVVSRGDNRRYEIGGFHQAPTLQAHTPTPACVGFPGGSHSKDRQADGWEARNTPDAQQGLLHQKRKIKPPLDLLKAHCGSTGPRGP